MTKVPIIEHDTWLYHPSKGSRLFGAGEQHPGGSWSDAPSANAVTDKGGDDTEWGEKLNKALANQKATFDTAWADLSAENEKLVQEAAARDQQIADLKAQIDKFDGDGDGKPGGRAAKA